MTPTSLLRGIGGSDVAAIVGQSKFKSPIDVWRRLVEGHQVEQTPVMRRGLLFEPIVRQMYAEETGAKLLGPLFLTKDWARASLDDHTQEKVVEFKTASYRVAHEWGADDDAIPPDYLCQVQWYCLLSGKPLADVAVLLGGDELRIFTLASDSELQGMLWEQAERFYRDYVLTKTPPPVDGSDSFKEWIAARFPKEVEPPRQADDAANALALELITLKAQIERDEGRKAELENRLKVCMAGAEGLLGDGWKATWKSVKGRTSTDWEALAMSLGATPSLINGHTKQGAGHRRFQLVGKK